MLLAGCEKARREEINAFRQKHVKVSEALDRIFSPKISQLLGELNKCANEKKEQYPLAIVGITRNAARFEIRDENLYRSALDICVREGAFGYAVQVVDNAAAVGVELSISEDQYRTMIDSCMDKGEAVAAIKTAEYAIKESKIKNEEFIAYAVWRISGDGENIGEVNNFVNFLMVYVKE